MPAAPVTRQAFLRFSVVFLGMGAAALADACSSSSSDGSSGSSGSSGDSGTSGSSGASGTSGSSGSSGSSGTSGSSGSSGRSGSSGSSGNLDSGAEGGMDAALDAARDADADAPPPTCDTKGGKALSISANHGHALVIPAADFVNPVEGTYDIMGGGTHNHTVTLTAAELTTLANGDPVVVTSSVTGHSHVVTVGCA